MMTEKGYKTTVEEWVFLDQLRSMDEPLHGHTDASIDEFAEAIRAGKAEIDPIDTTPSNIVLDGEKRRRAAAKAGLTKILTRRRKIYNPMDQREFALNQNGYSRRAKLNTSSIVPLVEEWLRTGQDPSKLPLPPGLRDSILRSIKQRHNPDPGPKPPAYVISRRGDVWRLGKHRIMCGDSEVDDDVDKLLDGAIPHLMVTDPPYGINYKGKPGAISGEVKNDDRWDFTKAYINFPGSVAYIWHDPLNYIGEVKKTIENAGFEVYTEIVWKKPSPTQMNGNYKHQHEDCFYWPAPGSEDTKLRCLLELEVDHGATEIYSGVQA